MGTSHVAKRFNVRSIPSFFLLRDGEIVAQQRGVMSPSGPTMASFNAQVASTVRQSNILFARVDGTASSIITDNSSGCCGSEFGTMSNVESNPLRFWHVFRHGALHV